VCFAPKVLSHDWLAGSSITYPNDDSDKDLQINLCYNMPNLHIWPNLKITNFKENPKLLKSLGKFESNLARVIILL
jgi:hypothetical protein